MIHRITSSMAPADSVTLRNVTYRYVIGPRRNSSDTRPAYKKLQRRESNVNWMISSISLLLCSNITAQLTICLINGHIQSSFKKFIWRPCYFRKKNVAGVEITWSSTYSATLFHSARPDELLIENSYQRSVNVTVTHWNVCMECMECMKSIQ